MMPQITVDLTCTEEELSLIRPVCGGVCAEASPFAMSTAIAPEHCHGAMCKYCCKKLPPASLPSPSAPPRLQGGVFAERAHSANYYAVYPGNTPENHRPTEACMIHSKQHRGCRTQDPGTRGYRWWKTADVSHSAGTACSAPPRTLLPHSQSNLDSTLQSAGQQEECC